MNRDATNDLRRRLLLAGAAPLLPSLPGCTAPLKPLPGASSTPDALKLLADSADAHGVERFARIDDVSVRYAGSWHRIVSKLQPVLVDREFRGGSEERLLPHRNLTAQAHVGPGGMKQVLRSTPPQARGDVPQSPGDVRVWFNGRESEDPERRQAAALVADCYALFLLGPMLLETHWRSERGMMIALTGADRIQVDRQSFLCDVLRLRLTPGLGFSESDDLALFIDRDNRLMRRVRFTLNGLESTRGAVAEVDTSAFANRNGVQWPTHFYERLLRPLPLGVHDWHLLGLDVNRGLEESEINGSAFLGKAAAPALPLAG